MAVFLTIGCIELLLGNVAFGPSLLVLFISQMLLGTVFGLAGGWITGWVVNRINLAASGMYPILVGAFCFLIYGLAARFGGSGFLAVYLAGLVIGNRPLVLQRGIRQFHETLVWLCQIFMFVVLGLLCFPSRLWEVSGKAILISVILILVARPIAVLASIFPFGFTRKELVFISWVGLKGAVPITLATFPLMLATTEQPMHAELLFNAVFFTVVVSAIVQGTTLAPVAIWLGLRRPRPPEPPVTLEINSLRQVNGEVMDYAISNDSRAAGRMVKELALPEGVVIAMIARGEQIILPQGQTTICVGDHVILVMRREVQFLVNQIFGSKKDIGPMISPVAIEFPLRPTTTVGDLRDLYALEIDGSASRTLDEVMIHELGNLNPQVGEAVRFGPVLLRIMRLSANQRIQLIGLSILQSDEEPQMPSAPVSRSAPDPANIKATNSNLTSTETGSPERLNEGQEPQGDPKQE